MIDILIVEDDSFIAELYERELNSEQLTTKIAKDGQEALDWLSKGETPRLVVLDIMLPKASGIEVLKFMKSKEELKNIPIIVLSNLGQEEIVNEAMNLGANSYLIKANFVPQEVVKEIKNLL